MPVALGNSLREAIRSARSGGRTVLYRKGKPAFAIVPAEDAEYMQKLEVELDNRLADEAYVRVTSFPWTPAVCMTLRFAVNT